MNDLDETKTEPKTHSYVVGFNNGQLGMAVGVNAHEVLSRYTEERRNAISFIIESNEPAAKYYLQKINVGETIDNIGEKFNDLSDKFGHNLFKGAEKLNSVTQKFTDRVDKFADRFKKKS